MLIRGGRVVDPSQGMDAVLDVLLAGGTVARVGRESMPPRTRKPWMRPGSSWRRG